MLNTVLFVVSTTLAGQRSSFEHSDGTTHWFEPIATPLGITWTNANRAAAKAGGYLATIASKDENDAVFKAIDDAKFWSTTSTRADGPWIGGLQFSGSTEPAGGWVWGEIELTTYRNWSAGKPDNQSGADRMHYGGKTIGSTWADSVSSAKMRGYVIEYSNATVINTIGLKMRAPGSLDGYTMISPSRRGDSFLIDSRGRIVNHWVSTYNLGMATYLEKGGRLLRCGKTNNSTFNAGGSGGVVESFNWKGELLWRFTMSDATQCLHHDVERLPNGNLLMIAWEIKTQAEALAWGRKPTKVGTRGMWPEKIIEVKPNGKTGGTIVWEWHVWDHAIQDYDSKKANFGKVEDHPELVDANFPVDGSHPDWLHANSISYNEKLDQILISIRPFDEIWIIDHSTTTAEAKGHTGGRYGKGGDLLYRWGNPIAYRGGTFSDQRLFKQHNAQWIRSGLPGADNILIFNNGTDRPPENHSSVDEIVPPVDSKGGYPRLGKAWGPANPKWTYKASTPKNFYAPFVSGAQRLQNGNTMVCHGVLGDAFEVTSSGKTVWEYRSPYKRVELLHQGSQAPFTWNLMFRSPRYFANGVELKGIKKEDLEPGQPIEAHDSALLVDGSTVDRRVKPGAQVDLTLRAGEHRGKTYLVGTSATPGLLPIDFRFARMGSDPILSASLSMSATSVFQRYLGSLDANGHATATVRLPRDSRLIGTKFYTTFAVVDRSTRSGLALISNTVVIAVE
jgi:hypothetical protein